MNLAHLYGGLLLFFLGMSMTYKKDFNIRLGANTHQFLYIDWSLHTKEHAKA